MVSILECFPVFGWELLPITYKTDIISFRLFCDKCNLILNDNEKDYGLYNITEDEVVIKEILQKQYPKRTKVINIFG